MADVFISYSKSDKAIAEALANDLKARGFDVWWDFDLYAGDDFHDMIRAEIAKAKAVVVIWSQTAVSSKWVRGEAQEADDLGTLIALHAPGFDTKLVPINFRAMHCEPVSSRERIVASIERKTGRPRIADSQPASSADSLAELRAMAKNGDASAPLQLAVMYDLGKGVEKDEAEAARWYRMAAERGNAVAQIYLGWSYCNGRGVAKDEAEAMRWFRRAADQDHADAQFIVAANYSRGFGVAKDVEEAVRWYRKAADQGLARAHTMLGLHYQAGHGAAKSEAEAVRMFRKAADQGYAKGQYNLGNCYADGKGVAKNEAEAIRWYRLAAEQGDEDAKAALLRRGTK